MMHKCEYPDCWKMAVERDSFFKKFHCKDHAFDVVVWPKEVIEPTTIIKKEKNSSSKKWGKRYF